MSGLDLVLAGAGAAYAAISRGGRSKRVPVAIGAVLLILSAIPVVAIGSTRQPAEIDYVALRENRLPAMTSWLRLDGDLREVAPEPGQYRYTLTDPASDALVVTVVADGPLPTGRTQVTGTVSGARSEPGTFKTIRADVPAEPPRHDPWLLFSLPAILVIPLLAGARLGYPVLRREGSAAASTPGSTSGSMGASTSGPMPGSTADGTAAAARLEGAPTRAEWSGWIGSERVARDRMRACTLTVEPGPDVCRLTLREEAATRTIAIRRSAPKDRVRLCRVTGCRPGLAFHGQSAEVVLSVGERATRDRLAAALE